MTIDVPSGVIRLFAAVIMLAIGAVCPGPARSQTFMSQAGHAEFTSSLPAITFTGESDHLVGRIDLSGNVVDFYLDLTTLETGIGKRDKDMRETLETDKYPFAEFFGTLETPLDIAAETAQPAIVVGEFTVHGVKRRVRIDGTITPTDGGLRVVAEWELNLNDYDIKPPRLLIIKVDEIQQVRIDTLLIPAEN